MITVTRSSDDKILNLTTAITFEQGAEGVNACFPGNLWFTVIDLNLSALQDYMNDAASSQKPITKIYYDWRKVT